MTKKMEQDMSTVAPHFFWVLMIVMGTSEIISLRNSSIIFFLTSEQKYHYTQMRLVWEAYWWWEDRHISCRY